MTDRIKLPVNYTKLHWRDRRRVREQYVTEQKGMCMFCEAPLADEAPTNITEKKIDWSLFPENFLKYRVHLQHDHGTGMTEGAVHSYCNAVMWQHHGR